jgi:hypothetical protein
LSDINNNQLSTYKHCLPAAQTLTNELTWIHFPTLFFKKYGNFQITQYFNFNLIFLALGLAYKFSSAYFTKNRMNPQIYI